MNICIWGNCQSSVLGPILKDALPAATIEVLPEVHLVNESDEDLIYSKLHAADMVFTQYIHNNYRFEWLWTETVKRTLKNKAISFPNIYFDGYFPGLGTAQNAEQVRLAGPLGSYHFLSIVESYNRGETHTDAARSFVSEEQSCGQTDTAATSLSRLRAREMGPDVIISDAIEERWRSSRLFYTQNHPKNELLVTLALRLLASAGVNGSLPQPYSQMQRLDMIDIPTQPHVRKTYQLEYPDSAVYRGVKFLIEDAVARSIGKQTYTASELVEQFFRFYEAVGVVKHAEEPARPELGILSPDQP